MSPGSRSNSLPPIGRRSYGQWGRLIGAFSDGVITRTDPFHLGDLAGGSADQRQLPIGTLLWGYGHSRRPKLYPMHGAPNAANLNQNRLPVSPR